jgi:hypothetical protein
MLKAECVSSQLRVTLFLRGILLYLYRSTIFFSLLNIALHVSEGLSVHHQESKTVHTASSIWRTKIPEMDKITFDIYIYIYKGKVILLQA